MWIFFATLCVKRKPPRTLSCAICVFLNRAMARFRAPFGDPRFVLGQLIRSPPPGPLWKARIIHLLFAQVGFDGRTGEVDLKFHPAGAALLARETPGAQP